ncbi:hypothetical protein GUJ93_ZPchr0008g13297 [Zizania palustris]|uniref:VTT domain-containing protein n=1 Tax=Zizania palustris TaxID=103762 RepID=A0A8J5RP58_ZIZPA|nr:hypothetical protein GUJ93_ZPchr0008g13297 [Zizania palustris]
MKGSVVCAHQPGVEVLAIPAITMSGGLLFGSVTGTIIVSIRGTLAAAVAFLIARYFAKERILKLCEGNKKFLAIDKAIGENGFMVITLLRLSPLLPFSLGNYLYGLTSVKFLAYVIGRIMGLCQCQCIRTSYNYPSAALPPLTFRLLCLPLAMNESLFTNCTRDFTRTVDYVFYTADSLMVESLLKLLDEESLRKDTTLHSPEWSSGKVKLNHIQDLQISHTCIVHFVMRPLKRLRVEAPRVPTFSDFHPSTRWSIGVRSALHSVLSATPSPDLQPSIAVASDRPGPRLRHRRDRKDDPFLGHASASQGDHRRRRAPEEPSASTLAADRLQPPFLVVEGTVVTAMASSFHFCIELGPSPS